MEPRFQKLPREEVIDTLVENHRLSRSTAASLYDYLRDEIVTRSNDDDKPVFPHGPGEAHRWGGR